MPKELEQATNEAREHHRRHHRRRREEERQEQQAEQSRQETMDAGAEPASQAAQESTPAQAESSSGRQHRTGKSTILLNELGTLEQQLDGHERYFKNIMDNAWQESDEAKQEENRIGLLRERDKLINLTEKIGLYREKAKGRRRQAEILEKTEELRERCQNAQDMVISGMEAIKSSAADKRTEDLIAQLNTAHQKRWAGMKTDKPTYAQYRELNSSLNYIEYQANRLEATTSERGSERRTYLRNELASERKRLELLLAKLSPEDQKEALKKQEKGKILEQALNTRYNAASPIVRLIWKAKAIKDVNRPEAPKKGKLEKVRDAYTAAKEQWDEISGDVSGVADPLVEHFTDGETETLSGWVDGKLGIGDWLKENVGTVVKWLAGKLKMEEILKKAKGAKERFDELTEMFEPVVTAGKFLMQVKDFMKKSRNMSPEEIRRNMESLLGDAVNSVVANVMKLVSLFKPVPFLGGIAGLIGNTVSIVQQVLQLIDRNRHKKEVNEEKELAKAGMADKGVKYAQDADLQGLNLYGFAGTRQETKGIFRKREITATHITRQKEKDLAAGTTTLESQSAALERSVGGGNIYEEMDELKHKKNSGLMSKEEKQRYYKMKTLARIREHKEMKEDKYVNEKRIRQNWIDIAHAGVDAVENIAGFVPGVGQAIAKGASFANTVAATGHKYGTELRQTWRNISGSEKSTANKEAKRSAMAENMYGQMLHVSGYMKEENDTDRRTPLFHLGEDSASKVYKQVDYLEMLTRTLSYRFSDMMDAQNRDDLMDLMSSAFAREG